ncbi:cytochrome P450 [Gymnopus androsaceus JB14]|uniref:Cytochrome P450 n=1 Tax=Gymnopus androsaceus JB14 TaxID=1447944 RepID=A0A6A4GX18_9AGAR|nr:cytochrome P450 [Gymnopus androsaceus JB14]
MPKIYIIALFLIPLFYVLRARRNTYRLPPGPRKLPIVENLFDMPRGGYMWLDYAAMCRRYKSDIIHLSALGNSIIVLNSARAVNDLLEKRSSIYSSRPSSVMLGELMGWGSTFIFRPNDDAWKAQRKIVTQAIPPTDPKRFHSKQISATHDLLRVLPQSDDIMKSLQTWAVIFITDITYGIQGDEAKLYLPTAIGAVESMAIAGTPGAFYVDQIPILKYVPEWFPGASFKRKAREWNKLRIKMTEDAYLVTKARLAAGTATPSLTSLALEEINHTQDVAYQEEVIKTASVAAYVGGSDTTVAALGAFLIAMLMNPEVQTKAHHELEKVLGPGDLPSFSDEPMLPYITAIVREILRHNPITPFAFPHLLIQDDIYEGYFLPKGSIIMPSIWSILHNVEDYPEPERFNPSRFLDSHGKLNPNIKDPATAAFGFGRRVCPGKQIALASIWIAVASILTCYTIEPELDENGKPIKPKGEWYSGPTLFNHPLPFKCRFIPRSKDVQASLGVSLVKA